MVVVAVKRYSSFFTLTLVALLNSCTPSKSEDSLLIPHLNQEWAMNKIWEDGQAEVAHYDAEMIIYDELRQFDYVHITVKEEFNEEFNVKTDNYDREDLFSVFKVNKFARIETENYPYQYLTSLFFRRDRIQQLHKMTHTGQEWCGNTFKQFILNNQSYVYDYNSYFDNYGDGEMRFDAADLIWEDQLSTLLRSLKFSEGLNFSHKVVESQVNTRTRKPVIYDTKFSVISENNLWRVTAELSPEKLNTYYFQKEYPNILIGQTSWNGFKLNLNEVSRYQYWR